MAYYLSEIIHYVLHPQNFLLFGIGLLIICTISFIDDIVDLSKKIRIFFHFVSVTLLMVFVNAFGMAFNFDKNLETPKINKHTSSWSILMG